LTATGKFLEIFQLISLFIPKIFNFCPTIFMAPFSAPGTANVSYDQLLTARPYAKNQLPPQKQPPETIEFLRYKIQL
jgi:hypothetical protein